MRSFILSLLIPLFFSTSTKSVALSISLSASTIILDNRISFSQQIIKPNTTYILKDIFDLKGQKVIIPKGCTLRFEGGMLVNGIVEDCCNIESEENKVLFKNISFRTPQKQTVKLSWFSSSSDAESLENAARFGYVDCTGNWRIDKPVNINNDIVIVNGDFTCKYGVNNIIIMPSDMHAIDYKKRIKKGAKEICGRIDAGNESVLSIRSSDVYYKTERTNNRNGTRGELMRIKRRNRNKIVFDTQEGTICEYNANVKLTFFKPLNVSLRGCRFHSIFKEDSDKGGYLVNIEKAKAEIIDCYFSGCSVGLALGDCIDSQVKGCTFEKIYPWALAFAGGTCNSRVTKCLFKTNRHGWTTLGESGVVKNCIVTQNRCENSFVALCPHANAFNITISNNIINGSQGGVGSFAPNCIIKDNQISNLNGVPAIYLTEAGGINPTVEGNSVKNCKGYSDAIRNYSVDLTKDISYITPVSCVVANNTIEDCTDYSGISCDYSKAGVEVKVNVTDNTLDNVGYTAISVNASTAVVTDNKINGVRRSSFVPISIKNINALSHKGYARVERNVVTQCNSDNDMEIQGYNEVLCNSNENKGKPLKVRIDDCKRVKRN